MPDQLTDPNTSTAVIEAREIRDGAIVRLEANPADGDLADVARLAEEQFQDARRASIAELQPQATGFLRETYRTLMLAWLNLIFAAREHGRRVKAAGAAGFDVQPFEKHGGMFSADSYHARQQLPTVAAGTLTPDEIAQV